MFSLPSIFPKRRTSDQQTGRSDGHGHVILNDEEEVVQVPPSENTTPSSRFTQILQLIHIIPVPMCLLDSIGCIKGTYYLLHMYSYYNSRHDYLFVLGYNEAFASIVELPVVDSKVTNVMEIIGTKDQDKFYTKLKEINASEASAIVHVGNCLTKLSRNGDNYVGCYDWSLSSSPHVAVAQAQESTSSNFIIMTGQTPNFSSPTLNDETHQDEELFHQLIPDATWHSFKAYFEMKTMKAMASQQALEIVETKRAFIRQMSHEIRTPLNIIVSGLNLLGAHASTLNAEVVELIEDIESASVRAVEILDDFLMFEKLDAHALQLNRTSRNVITLISSVVDAFKNNVTNNYSRIITGTFITL
jgi:hypothetical protein